MAIVMKRSQLFKTIFSATSALGLLLAQNTYAASRLTINANSSLSTGANFTGAVAPVNGDSVILSGVHNLVFDRNNAVINNVNLYGFGGTNFIISEHTSIGTITNSIDAVARAAALAANGMGGAVASGGDNTLKTKITINNKILEVNGSDLSAVDKIELTHAMSKIQFNAAMEVDSDIYDPGGRSLGIVQVSADTIFNGNIGQNGAAGAVIYQVIVDDTINTTFQSSVIRATELVLDNDSHIIINPVNNSVLIAAAINTTEAPGDLLGKITINPDAVNTVIFNDEIGGIDERVKKIKITDGLGAVTFREDVFAKQIKVGAANVTFEKAVNLVNSTLALGNADKQGLLNFTADSTVSLSAATFKGDISTKTNNEGTLIYNDLAKAGGVPT